MTTPSKAAMDAARPWECFQDPSYYDMWCVRQAHDRTFGQGFHLVRGEEAKALCDMLNAIAAHRIAAEQRGREAERAEICAWLRDQSPCKLQSAGYLADAIEARSNEIF
jgi:hypothetical protein